jgi:chromosome partitioning protein
MIITFAHTKGGVGKSTLAWNVAVGFQSIGYNVNCLDLDFQKTLSRVAQLREKNYKTTLKVISNLDLEVLEKEYRRCSKSKNDILVVDIGGFDSDMNRLAIFNSDITIVPIGDSQTEIWGFDTFRNILKDINNPKIHLLLNNIHPNVKNIDGYSVLTNLYSNSQIFKSVVRSRIGYKKCFINGGSVVDFDLVAKSEIINLIEEIKDEFQF